MPRYNATGITATLSIANLQATCSNIIDLRMGTEQRQDAERIENVFAFGRNLPEKPVGADGGEKGVLQFVGVGEDLPLFVVEAGDSVPSGGLGCRKQEEDDEVEQTPRGPVLADDSDSPLTSLSNTPSPTKPSPRKAPASSTSTPTRKRAKESHHSSLAGLATFSSFDRARSFLDAPAGLSALCLTVTTDHKSFLPKVLNNTKRGNDLKMEVFLNGELVGLTLLNTRGSAIELKEGKVRFHGTRLSRQGERGWTYDASASTSGDRGGLSATERWHSVSCALEKEANARGRNKWGDCPPSAEFLFALARLELPERPKSKHGLAVFDLVITAGSGKKYGPETAYITAPTRMDDPAYSVTAPLEEDPFADAEMLFGSAVREPVGWEASARDGIAEDFPPDSALGSAFRGPTLAPEEDFPNHFLGGALYDERSSLRAPTLALPPPFGAAQSSPEIPLIRQRRSATASLPPTANMAPSTPSKKSRLHESVAELDIEGLDLNKLLGSYENTRGKAGQRRTLRQRLNDIAQMNAANRQKAVANLRDELDEETMRAFRQNAARVRREKEERELMPGPSKKARRDSTIFDKREQPVFGFDAALMMLADAALGGEDGTFGVDLGMFWQGEPAPPMMGVGLEMMPAPPTMGEPPMPGLEWLHAPPMMGLDGRHANFDDDAFLMDAYPFGVNTLPEYHDEPAAPAEPVHTTPQKRTRASALANSPCSVPVKSPPKTRYKNTPTPQQRSRRSGENTYYPSIGSPIPIDPILHPTPRHPQPNNNSGATPSPPKTGRGANRTRVRWNPAEMTSEQALRTFEVPETLGQGSVVGYMPLSLDGDGDGDGKAGGKGKLMQRQVGKARGGEFREEQVVVGIRFVVT